VFETISGCEPESSTAAMMRRLGSDLSVFFQAILGFPALEQHDGRFRPLLVEDVTGRHNRAGPAAPLDGSKDLRTASCRSGGGRILTVR